MFVASSDSHLQKFKVTSCFYWTMAHNDCERIESHHFTLPPQNHFFYAYKRQRFHFLLSQTVSCRRLQRFVASPLHLYWRILPTVFWSRSCYWTVKKRINGSILDSDNDWGQLAGFLNYGKLRSRFLIESYEAHSPSTVVPVMGRSTVNCVNLLNYKRLFVNDFVK
jgi:hypothetical protein